MHRGPELMEYLKAVGRACRRKFAQIFVVEISCCAGLGDGAKKHLIRNGLGRFEIVASHLGRIRQSCGRKSGT